MRDMTQLHPLLQIKAAQLKEACQKQGISIQFSECLRTTQEQDALYAQGRTAPGSIVTNAKGSTYSGALPLIFTWIWISMVMATKKTTHSIIQRVSLTV